MKKLTVKLISFFLTAALVLAPMTVSFAEEASADEEVMNYEESADSWRYQDGEVLSEEEIAESEEGFGTESEAVSQKSRSMSTMSSIAKTSAHAEAKGVDVSYWNKKIDWEKVKKSGIKFAILRCGYGQDMQSQDDSTFLYNAKECERLGIPYGVYLYSYAKTVTQAKGEAAHTLRLLKGRKITLPVYYDLEENSVAMNVANSTIVNMAKTYCDTIQANGYKAGIYANLSWWNNILNSSSLDKYEKWVAQYYSKCTYSKDYRIWQYSSSGSVSGISGKVDVNYLMKHDGNTEFLKASTTTPSTGTGTSSGTNGSGGEKAVSYQVKVTVSVLNYRTGPGTSYQKKGSYKKGKVLSIKAVKGDWGKMSNGYWVKLTDNTQKVTASTVTSASYQVKVTVSVLNYRTGPGTSYQKKGSYKKGKVLTIKSTKNGWGKMSNGYWVKLTGNTKKVTASTATSSSYKVKITASSLNYRTGPGTKYKKKGSYMKGKIITIKSSKNGWGKMSNGYWVKLSYTKKI